MSLTTCLEEIKKVKPDAETEVEGGNHMTLAARQGRQRQAKERLTQLREEYAKELGATSMFIVSVGSGAQEFAQACEPFAGFVNDPEEFYADLAKRVCPLLQNGKPSMSNMFDVLSRHLEDKMGELGVIGYPQVILHNKYARAIEGEVQFKDLLKEVMNEQIGAEIVGVQAAYSTVDRAIERAHEGSTTLMLLPTEDESLARSLAKDLQRLTPNVFVVGAGKLSKGLKDLAGPLAVKTISEETVGSVLKTIKSMRK